MRPIETLIVEHREGGRLLSLEALGEVDAIAADREQLCASPFAADLIGLLIAEGTIAGSATDTPAASFVIASYSAATDPLTLLELCDHLEPLTSASKAVTDAIF